MLKNWWQSLSEDTRFWIAITLTWLAFFALLACYLHFLGLY